MKLSVITAPDFAQALIDARDIAGSLCASGVHAIAPGSDLQPIPRGPSAG